MFIFNVFQDMITSLLPFRNIFFLITLSCISKSIVDVSMDGDTPLLFVFSLSINLLFLGGLGGVLVIIVSEVSIVVFGILLLLLGLLLSVTLRTDGFLNIKSNSLTFSDKLIDFG